jgi:acyl-CoA thioesterase-1
MRNRLLVILICSIFLVAFKADESPKVILFFGDSLTAGYGLSKEQAFPAIVQRKINDKGYNYKVLNAGLSGETSAGGLARINWILKEPIDIFVLELGANDGLRGLPLKQTKQNLQQIINKVKAKNPDVKIVIAGMMMPPNLGAEYTADFMQLFPELAKKNDAHLIPFLLEGVAGNEELNLNDGIHPNKTGHSIVAENVWKVLNPLL